MEKAQILWMDLEMTGLDPKSDRILEVAVIATDWDFKEIARFEAVKKVSQSIIDRQMVGPFWQKYKAVKKSLVDQNKIGKNSKVVENELLDFIDQHFSDQKPVLLAGNSIHQDRKFIDREWPKLADRLHYRMLDVSAWKVVFDGKYQQKFSKREAHRAVDDIAGSIEELKYYLTKIGG